MTGATAFLPTTSGGEFNNELRQKFLALYPNRLESIWKPLDVNSSWVTLKRQPPIPDSRIINAISMNENRFHGCRWAERARFAILDIDKNSRLHNELGLARLKHTLELVGFDKPLVFQSSDSGGWHLYLSLSSWASSVELQKTIRAWFLAEGYEIKQGQLEIFPSNNGLRLPLQRGFGWLDENGSLETKREALSTEQAIAKFLDALDESQHPWLEVKSKIERRINELRPASKLEQPEEIDDGFSSLFSSAGMNIETYEAGKDYWKNGLTKPGQRHHAILCVGHYLWYGDENIKPLPGARNAARREKLITAWLEQNHKGHSQAILRGDWAQVLSDIKSACNWTPPAATERAQNDYPMTERASDRLTILTKRSGRLWSLEDFRKANIKRQECAREKISRALGDLLEKGSQVTIKALERLSGCRRETIRKHSDIWAAARLSKGLGDIRCPEVPAQPVFDTSVLPGSDSSEISFPVLEESELFKPFKPEFLPLVSGFCSMAFETLRLKISGATANNSTAMAARDSVAVTSSDFSSGVKRRRKLRSQVGEASGFVRSLNGTSPRLARVPSIYRDRLFLWHFVRARLLAPGLGVGNFYMELLGTNLTAMVDSS